MNNSGVVDCLMCFFADGAIFAPLLCINEAKYLCKNLQVKEGTGLIFKESLFSGEYSNSYSTAARDLRQRKLPLSSGFALRLGSVYCHKPRAITIT